MLIHLTGMSPRTASPRAREQFTLAGLLEQVLVAEGHAVDRDLYVNGTPDFVIVGVTSPISPGATYALSGLEAIGAAIEDETPLLLFVDDPDLPKTKAGSASAHRDNRRLYTDYLMGKRIRETRKVTLTQQRRISTAVEVLASDTWPEVLVPLHAWAQGSETSVAKQLGVVSDVTGVDLTAVVALMSGETRFNIPSQPRAHLYAPWFTDTRFSSAALEQRRVARPVIPINSAHMDDPAFVYSVAVGVHQGVVGGFPGWWTPTPFFAAQAHTVHLMDLADQELTGTHSPYYITADYVEGLSEVQHWQLVQDQRDYLKETTWSLDDLSSLIGGVLGLTSSFKPRATSSQA